MSNTWSEVYKIVGLIPSGKVATYGQIAQEMGNRISPAAVGWALRVCPPEVPWHRVVNAQGKLSTAGTRQQTLLESEGIRFDEQHRLDLIECRHLFDV